MLTLTKKFAASHFALPFRTTTFAAHADDKQGDLSMTKMWITLTVLCAVLLAQVGQSYSASDGERQILDPSPAQSVNQVVQWNKNLLVIVRTPGVKTATIHPTRSFALMHAAIYDAVNAIDGSHKPYLVHLTGVSSNASQDAAAAQAAHEVLVSLYPKLQ